jgi:virulence-associated protein VagC
MAEFKAKLADITLELVSVEGEKRIFEPHQRPTADFAGKIIKETNEYITAQKDLPKTEQDKIHIGNLKILTWIYKDFDTRWVLENFSIAEIAEISAWATNGLSGVKKEEAS